MSLMQYHIAYMPYVWSIILDIAIFLPFYTHIQFCVILHGILTFLCYAFGIISASNSLFSHGIPNWGNQMFFHKLFGAIIFGVATIQVIVGAISKINKGTRVMGSKTIFSLRWMHSLTGYLIAIAAKVQILVILKSGFKFWLVLIWSILFICVFVYRKLNFQRVAYKPDQKMEWEDEEKTQIRTRVKSDDKEEQLILYGNQFYAREKIASIHPAGREVIDSVRGNTCVDRYLYGMLPPDNIPTFPLHAHSTQVLSILGPPVASLNIPQPYPNFPCSSEPTLSCELQVKYFITHPVSSSQNLYLLYLGLDHPLKYQGYTSLDQLGRYYSLCYDSKTTRLYSVVNFLNQHNVLFMRKAIGAAVQIYEGYGRKDVMLPLLVKKYWKGRFTPELFQHRDESDKKYRLSCAKGKGLHLGDITKGTIVMVGGGTGINPFLDLIDLLFKDLLLDQRPDLQAQILAANPVLSSYGLRNYRFVFLLSVNHVSQIHPLIQIQLQKLVQANRIDLKLKIKDGRLDQLESYRENRKFDQVLNEILGNRVPIQRVMVCGPPSLNRDIAHGLERLGYHKYIIL